MIGHHGPIVPGELWASWNLDWFTWGALAGAALVYGWAAVVRPPSDSWRPRCFFAGLGVAAVALVSPLDALSGSLGSAHMVQHVLLTMVAAPLLVLGAAVQAVLRALPPSARRRSGAWRRHPLARAAARAAGDPVLTAGVFVAVLWIWHARGPYEAALGNDVLHAVEHATFFAAAALSWAALLSARRRRLRSGVGVLVLFGLSMQCGLLGVLLTFATEPWYPTYETTTQVWGLSPLTDQQLSGVIMWVPAGGIYLVVALVLLRRLISSPPPVPDRSPTGRKPATSVDRLGARP